MNKTPVNRSHTVKRLLGYVSQDYRGRFLLVLLCIMVSAIASVAGSLFLKTLIDDYIEPVSYTHLSCQSPVSRWNRGPGK